MFLLQAMAQHIDEGLVRELPSGWQGPPHQHISPLRLCPAGKVAGQARLADAGLPLQQDELRLSRMHTLVALDQAAELGCSSQQRAIQQVGGRLSRGGVSRPRRQRTDRSSAAKTFGQSQRLGFRLHL